MDVVDQCGFGGRACSFSVQYWPEFTLSRFELNETWSFLLASFNLKIWGGCSTSMLCKVPNFLSALVVKWQIGSANALPSHGPGNEETFRKWGNPQEARLVGRSDWKPVANSREAPESLWAPSSTQTANCKEVRRCFWENWTSADAEQSVLLPGKQR